MSNKEKLIQKILESDNPGKLISALFEAIDMMNQGKSNKEIRKHFGIA